MTPTEKLVNERRETSQEAADRLTRLLDRTDWRTASRAHIEGARNALQNAANEIAALRASTDRALTGPSEVEQLRAVVQDMLGGIAYLRSTDSVPYGFGIDRLEQTGKAALASGEPTYVMPPEDR